MSEFNLPVVVVIKRDCYGMIGGAACNTVVDADELAALIPQCGETVLGRVAVSYKPGSLGDGGGDDVVRRITARAVEAWEDGKTQIIG